MPTSLAFILLAAAVCQLLANDVTPGWVKNGRDMRFPESQYLQAVGQASGRQGDRTVTKEAEIQAMQQIAQQLTVRIHSRITLVKFEDNESGQYKEHSLQNASAATSIALSGLQIAGSYYDKKNKTHHTLMILDRRIAATALEHEWSTYQYNARHAMQTARELLNSRQPVEAIKAAREAALAEAACSERESILAVLAVGQTPNYAAKEIIRISDITRFILEIGPMLKCTFQSKMPIQLEPGQFSAQVQGFISYKGFPLRNLSLTAKLVEGHALAEISQPTDDDGFFALSISQLAAAPFGKYKIGINISLRDYALDTLVTASRFWNDAINSTFMPSFVHIHKAELQLEDYCAGAMQELAAQLPASTEPFILGTNNISYAETGASSSFLNYLKENISVAAADQQKIRVLANHSIEEALRKAKSNYTGKVRPDRPEIIAELTAADGILTGLCWESTDELKISLKIITRNSNTTMAAATMHLSKRLVPENMPYLPVNYSAFKETQKLGDVKTQKSNLTVDVWVDRGSGAVYHKGEQITLYSRASIDCYLYLIYHDAGGNDILIFPNARQPNNRILGHVIYQIPDGRDSFDWIVSKPFGSEVIKAIAAEEPLDNLPGIEQPNGLTILQEGLTSLLRKFRNANKNSQTYGEASCVITTME